MEGSTEELLPLILDRPLKAEQKVISFTEGGKKFRVPVYSPMQGGRFQEKQ